MPKNIALIGYGALARAICTALAVDPTIKIAQVLVRPQSLPRMKQEMPGGVAAITAVADLRPDIDFVMECAGHEAVRQVIAGILARGIDAGIVSAGALADPALHQDLRSAALEGGASLRVVPGAIGGIDALAAAGSALDSVTYVARKPPQSWVGSPAEKSHDLGALTTPTAIFQGTARQAALAFPKNANVVATVALAGIGFDDTQVTLMADPKATGNSHQIRAAGALFDLDYTTQGAALPDNPKTSALTAYSALRTLRHLSKGIII